MAFDFTKATGMPVLKMQEKIMN